MFVIMTKMLPAFSLFNLANGVKRSKGKKTKMKKWGTEAEDSSREEKGKGKVSNTVTFKPIEVQHLYLPKTYTN